MDNMEARNKDKKKDRMGINKKPDLKLEKQAILIVGDGRPTWSK